MIWFTDGEIVITEKLLFFIYKKIGSRSAGDIYSYCKWDEIFVIKKAKVSFFWQKKIRIISLYKNKIIKINSFENYEEILKVIIDKTEDNKIIDIDKKVYKWAGLKKSDLFSRSSS